MTQVWPLGPGMQSDVHAVCGQVGSKFVDIENDVIA